MTDIPEAQDTDKALAQQTAHATHTKELQLGVDPDDVPEHGVSVDPDSIEAEAIWADATTVDSFAEELTSLEEESEETILALREARNKA